MTTPIVLEDLARQALIEAVKVGTIADPTPGPGEVRIRIAASGINPGDIKKRQDAFGYGMPYPRAIPHSDGAGRVDLVGEGVAADWIGRRVWCYGAQSYRPFGTAADYTVVPASQAVSLPDGVSFEQGASAFPPSPRIAVCTRRDRSTGGPCWCRAAPGRSGSTRCNSPVVLARGWSRRSELRRMRPSRGTPARITSSTSVPT